MGFFFFIHAPTQLSTLPKKREHKRSKTAVVRAARIKGMPQLAVQNNTYQFSRCAFSAAFNQQTPGSLRNRSPPCWRSPGLRHRWGPTFGSFSLPPAALGLAPTHTWLQRIPIIRRVVCQVGERVTRQKQDSFPHFYTFFLLQARHHKLWLYCSVPVALNDFHDSKTRVR